MPQRRLASLRVHPLVLPIGIYWLAIAGVAHAVIERARQPAETVGASEPSEPSFQPAPRVQEDAPVAALPSPSAPPRYQPAPLPVVPEALSQSDGPSEPLTRDPEPAPAAAERERERPRERPTETTHTTARIAPPPPVPQQAASPALGEMSPGAREQSLSPRPERSDDELPRSSLPSCEAAAESAQETIEVGGPRGAPDLTRGTFASVLENGAYLQRCAIPARTALEICAAVQGGRVVGVSVRAQPQDSRISSCVRRAVAALRFPSSARLDVTRTRFDATP